MERAGMERVDMERAGMERADKMVLASLGARECLRGPVV